VDLVLARQAEKLQYSAHMRNGIYRVEFRSGRKIGPSGLVVLKDGSVNGGDDGFAYRGTYNVEVKKSLYRTFSLFSNFILFVPSQR
jgi:T3SS negative regulator,GrlR